MGCSMTIIEKNKGSNGAHGLQSQSDRTECWLDGWIAVPDHLEDKAWETRGWCDLDIRDGVLVDIIQTTRPEPEPQPTPTPSYEERLAALESAMMAMMMGGTGNV